MSRGKRYETEGKLNYQKVFAVIIAIAVLIMFIYIVKNVLKEREKITKDYEYFSLYAANKWGVINQDGEQVIIPSYQEMIVIPNKEKDVFICTYDINDETGEYITYLAVPLEVLENAVEHKGFWSSECEPYYTCSSCNHTFSLFQAMKYCPNCGAKMVFGV